MPTYIQNGSCKSERGKKSPVRLLAVLCIAVAPALLISCSPTSDARNTDDGSLLHNLDDRVRLLECRLLNAESRDVFGEPAVGQRAVNDALDYDEESIEHDEESIEHDEESIEHDEESIEHDEESIEHDEESIEHDEAFKNLVSCRRDTLELRKKYLSCVRQRQQCIKDGGAISKCNHAFAECAAETRKSE